jgi:hypothetical protein
MKIEKLLRTRYWACLLMPACVLSVYAWADEPERRLPESYIALLQSDVQAKKTSILAEKLALSDDEAKTFWVVQRSYEYELSKLNDELLDIMRGYVLNWDNMSAETATGLGKRLLEYEKKRVVLRQKYYDRLSKELSPKIAAEFFQLEIQMESMIDVAIGSVIPLIK